MRRPSIGSNHVVWVSAALYFAFYVPYSGLTKALSTGAYPDAEGAVAWGHDLAAGEQRREAAAAQAQDGQPS